MGLSIDPIPFWKDLKKYSIHAFRGDLVAAISVALLGLPQAMAFAFLAGLPLSAGIFSVVFGTIFAAGFGASATMVVATTNTIAILLQSGTSEILYTYYRGVTDAQYELLSLRILTQVTLIVGVLQIFGGFFKLGKLTQFTSRSVMIGYIAGTAIAIGISQLFPFFGIADVEGYQPVYQKGWYLISHLIHLHWPTTLIGLGSLTLLIAFDRVSEKIPGPALVFLIAGIVVALFHLAAENVSSLSEIQSGHSHKKVALLGDLGIPSSDLPQIEVPYFEFRLLNKVLPLAFAIALISILGATAIGRSYTTSKDPLYDDNQESYGLGMSNFVCAFLGAMPGSGSFSRTALNRSSGAQTRFAAILSGVIVFMIVALFGFAVTKIPLAALAALMILTSYTTVNLRHFVICLKATASDAIVLIATVVSSLLFTLDVALYIGVVLSIVLYLKQAAVPGLVEYAFNNIGKLRPLESEESRPDARISIIQTEGELFFGAADVLQTKLREISEDENIKVVILQLLNTRTIDASICLALRLTHKYLQETNRHLLVSGISRSVWKVLVDSGLMSKIGEANCFPANEQLPSEATRLAYAVAKSLVRSKET